MLIIPEGFDAPEFPEDNEYSYARWKLGKRLFFDPIMSSDGNVSCASCHKPNLSFSDDIAFSPGVDNAPGVRNSPSLANVAYHPYFTREGGVPTLEMQVGVPIQEHNEFNTNIHDIADRMKDDPTYVDMCNEAYGQPPNPHTITRSIGLFERTLLSGNSAFDKYTYQGNLSAMTEQQLDGMELFMSDRTNCSACHSGFNFTDYSFENNGLYQNYDDPGRMRLTNNVNDRARFKTPSLRNVSVTAPYMHDGSVSTLEEVVDHYISGGADHKHKSEFIRPLDLSDVEKESLLAFLNSLTDYEFLEDSRWENSEN